MNEPHKTHIRKSMSLTGRSEKACMESYGAYLCIALDLPDLRWIKYDNFLASALIPIAA